MPSVLTISRPGEIAAAAKFLTEAPAAYKRNLNPTACRLRFREAYSAS